MSEAGLLKDPRPPTPPIVAEALPVLPAGIDAVAVTDAHAIAIDAEKVRLEPLPQGSVLLHCATRLVYGRCC